MVTGSANHPDPLDGYICSGPVVLYLMNPSTLVSLRNLVAILKFTLFCNVQILVRDGDLGEKWYLVNSSRTPDSTSSVYHSLAENR